MKKIYKIVKQFMLYEFKSYRIIATENHIEVKLTPKSNKVNEINYSVQNNKYKRGFLVASLEIDLGKVKEGKL